MSEDEVAPRPEQVLGELAALRRQARSARHAYWFPLVLYGVLIGAAAPLYVQAARVLSHPGLSSPPGPAVMLSALGGLTSGYVAVYWLFALVAGIWLTALWYRRHARRAGVMTPVRRFVGVGVAVTAAAILVSAIPLLLRYLQPGDVVIRGTFPDLIIAAGLWVLARAERSWALACVAALYSGAALLASLYNVENLLFRLGWSPTPHQFDDGVTVLPGVLLPALVLLVAGLCAFIAQRPRRVAGP